MSKDKICGIYCIENSANGKKYIGQSTNIYGRWKSHKSELKHNRHYNIHLQNAWNKYSESSFIFSILKKCNVEELDYWEVYFIDLYDTYKNGYNRDKGGFHQYKKIMSSTKEKMKNTIKNRSIEEKKRIHEKLVDAHNDEAIPIFQINLSGEIINEWKSQRYASRELGFDQCCIWECVNHKRKTYNNFIWISKSEYENGFNLNHYINQNTQARKINQYDLNGNLIHIWDSANEAGRNGFDCSCVIKCCKEKIKFHKGYIFRYA